MPSITPSSEDRSAPATPAPPHPAKRLAVQRDESAGASDPEAADLPEKATWADAVHGIRHRGENYTLAGPGPMAWSEVTDALTSALGRPIRYEPSVIGYMRHLSRRKLPRGAIVVQTILHFLLRFGQGATEVRTRILGRLGGAHLQIGRACGSDRQASRLRSFSDRVGAAILPQRGTRHSTAEVLLAKWDTASHAVSI